MKPLPLLSTGRRPRVGAPVWTGAMLACAFSACIGGGSDDTERWTGTLQHVDHDLSPGVTGEDAQALNKYLTEVGYLPNAGFAQLYPAWRPIVAEAPRDVSIFDEHTEEAVRQFQIRYNLLPTGIVDRETRGFMEQAHSPVPEGIPRMDPTDKFSIRSGSLGRRELTVKISGGSSTLTPTQVQSALGAALSNWQAVTSGLTFRFITGSANANILFQFVKPAGNVTVAFSGQTISFDPNAGWNMAEGSSLDLQTNAQRMVGAVLGFGTSSYPGSQMGSLLATRRELHFDDKLVASAVYDTYVMEPYFRAWDIAVGANGDVWAISGIPKPDGSGNHRVAKREFGVWQYTTDGMAGDRIAVDPRGVPWIVQVNGNILRHDTNSWSSGTWTLMPDRARDIGIGGALNTPGHVWMVGQSPVNGGGQVKKFNGTGWTPSNGGAIRVSVTNVGIPWLVAASGTVFRHTTSEATTGTWEQLGGILDDIAVGPMEPSINQAAPIAVAWSLATNGNFAANISAFAEQPSPYAKGWLSGTEIPTTRALAIAVKPDGQPLILDIANQLWESPR